jgi:hypothetical protein
VGVCSFVKSSGGVTVRCGGLRLEGAKVFDRLFG